MRIDDTVRCAAIIIDEFQTLGFAVVPALQCDVAALRDILVLDAVLELSFVY